MGNVNNQFLLSMLIVILGYFCKKFNVLEEKDGESLSRIIFNITLPALIINTFSTIKIDFSLIMLTIISIIYGGIMAILALFIFKRESRSTRGMLSMLLPGFNIGLFAYPLVEAIWGEKSLKYFGMFDMGNAIILFCICYLIANYFSSSEENISFKSILKKISKSIPLLAYMLTLIVNIFGLHFPGTMIDIAKILSKANMPLSLLLLGLYLNFSFETSYWKNMGKILTFRYIIGLMVGATLFFIVPFDSLFRYTLLIGLILPIGLAVVPYAVEFNYDQRFVGTLSNITILISFLLVWIIVGISPSIR